MYHFIGRDVIALRSMRAVHLLQCPQMLKLLCARVKLPAVCVTYAYLNIYDVINRLNDIQSISDGLCNICLCFN